MSTSSDQGHREEDGGKVRRPESHSKPSKSEERQDRGRHRRSKSRSKSRSRSKSGDRKHHRSSRSSRSPSRSRSHSRERSPAKKYPRVSGPAPSLAPAAGAASASGNPSAAGSAPQLTQSQAVASLPTVVQTRLNELWSSGQLSLSDLDARILGELGKLEAQQQLTALDALVKSNANIVNKSGFFMGILSKMRARSAHLATLDAMGVNPGTGVLHAMAQVKLDALYNTGQLQKFDLDQAILESLGQFDPMTQCSIIDTFLSKNLSSITNKSGYMAGIMKRYRQEGSHLARAQPVCQPSMVAGLPFVMPTTAAGTYGVPVAGANPFDPQTVAAYQQLMMQFQRQ